MTRSLVDGMCLEAPVGIPGAEAPDGLAVDWTITIDRGPPAAPTDASIDRTGDVRDDQGVWATFGRRGDERFISLRGVGDVWAHPGERRVRLVPVGPESHDVAALRRVSPYLAALLGRTALHAASVVLPRGAVLFCADSGTGKSTLARALDRLEFAVLGDDHLVLHTGDRSIIGAFPSFPFIDIRNVATDRTGPSDGMGHGEGKTSVQLFSARPQKAVPIAAIAFLVRGSKVTNEPIERADALARLLRDVVFVADPADEAAQVGRLDTCLALLKAVPAVRLEIPDDLARIASTAAEVAALWSGEPT